MDERQDYIPHDWNIFYEDPYCRNCGLHQSDTNLPKSCTNDWHLAFQNML